MLTVPLQLDHFQWKFVYSLRASRQKIFIEGKFSGAKKSV